MPTTISDIMSALDDLIIEHFKATNEGGGAEPFLAFEIGTPMPDETFHLPPENPAYSPALALEYLSHHANTVPHVHQRLFERTGKTIDGLYEILLLGSSPADTASMELLGGVKDSAKPAFENTLGSSIGVADRFRPTHGTPVNWYEAKANDNWTTIKIDRSDTPPAPPAGKPIEPRLLNWRLASESVRPLLSEPLSVRTVSSIAEPRAVVAQSITASQFSTPITASERTFSTRQARVFETSAAAGRRFQLATQPAEAIQLSPGRAHRFIDREAMKQVSPVFTLPAEQKPVSSDGFSLNVELCVVNLRRPWLSDSLLNLRDWFVPSFAKGAFSNGTGAGDEGIFPVLPIACILIRNLTIKAQWSDQDKGNLENSTHLGSFSLLGRSYDKNTATLTVPGMQSVAWICDPMPVLPPADPPAA